MVRRRIGIDIGGTFTDFSVVDTDGDVILWKEDTVEDPALSVAAGLDAIAGQLDLTTAALMDSTDVIVHGTTVATNMLIQRRGAKVGLLSTEGFRDVVYFRDGYKPHRFDLHVPHPGTLVDRWMRLGVRERIDRSGTAVEPLDEDGVREAARHFGGADIQAVAVAFLWSIVNPEHELRAAAILREELPGVDVVCSHAVLPEIREWERTSATVLSAYILPRIRAYLGEFEAALTQRGFATSPLIMQNNGGCAGVGEILRRPMNIVASGPAAAPAGALHFSRRIGGDLLIIDMGGTSLDACLIRDGRPEMSRTIQVQQQPVGSPAVDINSIGAGGGSIGWVDGGGALRVGPQSAGGRPGPACYGLGGTAPTVTDANVVLGYLSQTAFLGGRRRLRDDLAAQAIDSVAEPLGLTRVEAAAGIVRIVNINMVEALRAVSVERGVDPRGFTMVCAGGAGGLHAAALAREMQIRRVFVPREAGVLCAFGMSVTDVRHDHARAFHVVSDSAAPEAIDQLLNELQREATAALHSAGFSGASVRTERLVDGRYPGQHNELTIRVPGDGTIDTAALRRIEGAFHEEHERHFSWSLTDRPVELLHWRVTAIGENGLTAAGDGEFEEHVAVPYASRPTARGGELVATPAYAADELRPGAVVAGPAVIDSATTTIVVHEGDILRAVPEGYEISVGEQMPPMSSAVAAPDRRSVT